jgi:hypothetical protein
MIELGSLVKWKTGLMGIVTEIHTTKRDTQAYRIKWFNGKMGVCSAWQFEVIA